MLLTTHTHMHTLTHTLLGLSFLFLSFYILLRKFELVKFIIYLYIFISD